MIPDTMLRQHTLARRQRQLHQHRQQASHTCACGKPASRHYMNDFACSECIRVLKIYYDWRQKGSNSLYSEHRIIPAALVDDIGDFDDRPMGAVAMLMEG